MFSGCVVVLLSNDLMCVSVFGEMLVSVLVYVSVLFSVVLGVVSWLMMLSVCRCLVVIGLFLNRILVVIVCGNVWVRNYELLLLGVRLMCVYDIMNFVLCVVMIRLYVSVSEKFVLVVVFLMVVIIGFVVVWIVVIYVVS